ncbi:MAG TPA: carboxypeptidase regulatory-like domain-containing protein, partial [Pedobacter sp.]
MKVKLLLFISALLLFVNCAKSQTEQSEIKGVILDSLNNKPIEYVILILKDNSNNVVKTALSKTDGTFVFSTLKSMTYMLTIQAEGFRTRNISLSLADTAKGVRKSDTLYMTNDVHSLKEVVIKDNKPIVEQDIDRISYNIQADPESKSLNVLQIMRKVPLLSIDSDNSIRLRGNANYRIFINGKPSTIVDRNPQAVLQNMAASSIEKVEVITTIPAKYEAESLGGIINIVTTKRISDGYLASVNASHRFLVGGPGVGGNFTFKDGKLGISGFLGGGLSASPQITNSSKRSSSTTMLSQNTHVKLHDENGYLGTDVSYEIDSLNLLTGQFNINNTNNNTNSDLHSSLSSFNNPTQSYRLIGDNVAKG